MHTLRIPRHHRRYQRRRRIDKHGHDATSDVEPALGNLVTATLWEQNADEERPLPEVDIPTLERLLRITRRVTMPPTPRGPVAEA